MPRIRHWFHVSHDINSDGEVWELTDKFGVTGLRLWLELLSIADRNHGTLPDLSESFVRQLSIKCNTTQTRVRLMLQFSETKTWVVSDPSPRIRNWLIYNPSWGNKKEESLDTPLPSPLPTPSPKEDISPSRRKHAAQVKPWPPDDVWLKDLIGEQAWLNGNAASLNDYAWWEHVASLINGIERDFIETQFAKISAWCIENPKRKPTAKGAKRFVRTWLERARNDQRRLYVVKR